jgi:hypothetical protein
MDILKKNENIWIDVLYCLIQTIITTMDHHHFMFDVDLILFSLFILLNYYSAFLYLQEEKGFWYFFWEIVHFSLLFKGGKRRYTIHDYDDEIKAYSL